VSFIGDNNDIKIEEVNPCNVLECNEKNFKFFKDVVKIKNKYDSTEYKMTVVNRVIDDETQRMKYSETEAKIENNELKLLNDEEFVPTNFEDLLVEQVINTSKADSDYKNVTQMFAYLQSTVTNAKEDEVISKGKMMVDEGFLPLDLNTGKPKFNNDFGQNVYLGKMGQSGDSFKMVEKVDFEMKTTDFNSAEEHRKDLILEKVGLLGATIGQRKGQEKTATEIEYIVDETNFMLNRKKNLITDAIVRMVAQIFGDSFSIDNFEFN
jgi:hypothetical protein